MKVCERFTTRCVNKTSAPHGIRVTKGAVHVAVSRGFVEYAIYDQRAHDILTWMNKSCYIPDEAFFTTLNHNPHLGVPGAYKGHPETTVMANSRKPYLARYKNRQRISIYHSTCRGKWVRGMCVYGHKDLPVLRGRRELFANKFHLHTFPVAYGCMEELIFNRTRDEFQGKRKFNASWYSTFDFVTNKVE
ncbi:N-acetyllactosaminide beta-1,6-N-acetylglucosaminyl-transferase-like isoform X2 [Ruditapes philippinarum]|uniref:N-acetyllactosaminide beta-1,6-N-acetylglucosaminyl-transferase-like isoform X2 n=1 Tax=Ruditapes philippinarum TaxID=129788 RepID=UPI00295B3862|nr:N-acetyllactosaminide beta-1,6-N-acetylglucosaminyl-transferase-like isoform X2 [Ruditapes philippinarum]